MNANAKRKGSLEIKRAVHKQLLDSIDLNKASQLPRSVFKEECSRQVSDLLRVKAVDMDPAEQEKLVRELLDDIFGLGPLEPLLSDPSISDILVSGCTNVWIERHGRLEKSDVVFDSDAQLLQVIQRIIRSSGRRIDESSPLVDSRLPDGSRVNAVIPPLSIDGPQLCIRRFTHDDFDAHSLIAIGSVDEIMMRVLNEFVRLRMSMVISGGAGAGKTTTLNALSMFIPEDERIITIEDAAELNLHRDHVVRLETRMENIEGRGQVDARSLVKNALRMRPDRIIVGECRGAESFDMLQAMNTGHEGSMTTVHANSAMDAFSRMENMLAMTGLEIPIPALREYLTSAVQIVVQMTRIPGGRRVISGISEVVGVSDGMVKMNELFRFQLEGIDDDGFAHGKFQATGIVPACLESLTQRGSSLKKADFSARSLTSVSGPSRIGMDEAPQ